MWNNLPELQALVFLFFFPQVKTYAFQDLCTFVADSLAPLKFSLQLLELLKWNALEA